MPSIGQNLQTFTGNGDFLIHMSEKFSSGTINPKQTNRQTRFSPNEFISIVHNNVLTKLDLIVAEISMYDISGTHLDNNTSNHALT